jgi:hypothetical protein
MRVWSWIIVTCFIGLYPYATQAQTRISQVDLSKLIRIVPVESTAGDVKKLLGEPLDRSPDFYKLDDYNLLITYASGLPCEHPCYEKGRSDGWSVPRDAVITVAIFVKAPFHQKDLKNFGIDLSKYKKWEEPDHVQTVYYSNAEEGIGININGDQVNDISLFPAAKYLQLMCPKTIDKPACQTNRSIPCGNGTDQQAQ